MSINKKSKKIFNKEKKVKLFLENNQNNRISIAKTSKIPDLNNSNNKTAKSIANNQDNNLPTIEINDLNSPSSNLIKKNNKKEVTLKEIRQYCLLNTNFNNNTVKNKKAYEYIKYLANEFLHKCKQLLDEKQFEALITQLGNIDESKLDDKLTVNSIITELYKSVQKNNELKLIFCAFLSNGNAMNHDLFLQSLQYEKTNEFIEMLEKFISNKCSMKRLLQSIISTCSSNLPITNDNVAMKECQHYQQQKIINDIKAKVKSSTKNNPLVSHELDYLFDQQFTNIKPKYEKVSLIKENQIVNNEANTKIKIEDELFYEYVDLSKDVSINDNGTRKCTCECHQTINNSNGDNDNLLQTIFNHCILCSLKLIKGKLCIKCEGKKAIPLNYKLINSNSCKA